MSDDAAKSAPAARRHLAGLTAEERETWRLAEIPNRVSADERNLPDEFPFGWFALAYSDEVPAGTVRPVRAFSRELVLWRGEDGTARVLDAYCAHYGAHMGHGGTVYGNQLECPFHGWRYDGTGAVQEISYARVVPPNARQKDCVQHWPVAEACGFIWVWYHPARVEPLWEVKPLPEVGNPDWTPFARFEWNIYSSLENMADNAIDVSHFKFVHGAPTVPAYETSFEGRFRRVLAKITFVTPRGPVDGTIESFTYGPGQGWVYFRGLSETLLVNTFTPVERDHLKIHFAFTQPRSQTNGSSARLANALIADVCQQLDQDKVILDRFQRRDAPMICDGDGPFGQSRRYYSQFFATRSTPAKAAE